MKRLIPFLALLFFTVNTAHAQSGSTQVVTTCLSSPLWVAGKAGVPFLVDVNGNLCTSASVTASISGFAPGGSYTSLTATGSSADAALPTGAVTIAYNTGTTAVSCNLTVGAGSSTTNKDQIQASSWIAYTVGSNTHVSCIDQTGSASNVIIFSGGTGLPTGSGGGSGGGGGGAITAASGSYASGALSSGSMVDLGSQADAACGTDNGSCSAIALIKRTNQNITTYGSNPIPAQTPSATTGIGAVSVDPCNYAAKTTINVFQTASSTIITGVSAKKVYVCGGVLIGSAAATIGFIEGTGTVCATGTAVLAGVQNTTTPGMALAANGGFNGGGALGTSFGTATAADNVCMLQTGTANVSGWLSVVIQ